jgi:hypothetical protein
VHAKTHNLVDRKRYIWSYESYILKCTNYTSVLSGIVIIKWPPSDIDNFSDVERGVVTTLHSPIPTCYNTSAIYVSCDKETLLGNGFTSIPRKYEETQDLWAQILCANL